VQGKRGIIQIRGEKKAIRVIALGASLPDVIVAVVAVLRFLGRV